MRKQQALNDLAVREQERSALNAARLELEQVPSTFSHSTPACLKILNFNAGALEPTQPAVLAHRPFSCPGMALGRIHRSVEAA